MTCDSDGFATIGLKALREGDNAKGVPGPIADKLRKLLFTPETADNLDQVGLIDYH